MCFFESNVIACYVKLIYIFVCKQSPDATASVTKDSGAHLRHDTNLRIPQNRRHTSSTHITHCAVQHVGLV